MARSADAARGKIAEHPIDVILMDIQMPGLDGYGFTRELKANPATAAIPIVALTARNLDVDVQMALEAGCVELWVKPLPLSSFADRLRAIIADSRSADKGKAP